VLLQVVHDIQPRGAACKWFTSRRAALSAAPTRAKGVLDERLDDLRWLFEEMRPPKPVSIKRIQKSFE
jgi:hypothetical protein